MSSSKAETTSEQELQNPKTFKTYLDFKKTLSEEERDNFLNFVREQIQNLEKPINDLEAWLASKNAANQNRWEVYYENYQKQGKEQKPRNTQRSSEQGNLTPDKQRAIAEFRERMKLEQSPNEPELKTNSKEFDSNEPTPKTEPEETNSEKSQQQRAAFDELLDNPPERKEKSLAQLRREQIDLVRRKQQGIKQKNQEAAETRAKQLDPDLERRKADMLRQIEEWKQRQQQQSAETDSRYPEIDAEDSENA